MSSHLDDEEKPDEYARRFNKFESTRTSKIEVEDNLTHGSFIDNRKQIDYPKPDKLSVNPFSHTPLKKNLANNRLQQLRDKLKTDVKQKCSLVAKDSNVGTSNQNPYIKYRVPKRAENNAVEEFPKSSQVLQEEPSLEPHQSSLTKYSITRGCKRNIGSVSDVFNSNPDCSEPKKFALDRNREYERTSYLNSYNPTNEQFKVRSNSNQNKNNRQSRVPTFDKSPIKLKLDDFKNANNSNNFQPCTVLDQRLSRNKSITEDFINPNSNVPRSMKKLVEDRNTYSNNDYSGPQHLSPLLKGSSDKRNVSEVNNLLNSPPTNYELHSNVETRNDESISYTNNKNVFNKEPSSNSDTKIVKLETIDQIPKTKSENSSVDFIEKPNSLKTCSSTPVSQRLSKIKDGFRQNIKTSTYSIENKHYTSHVTDPYENNPQCTNFKPCKSPDPLQSGPTISYHDSKLEMTSFWVKNLPNENYQLPQNVPLPADSDSPDEMEWTNAEPDLDVEVNDKIENIPETIQKSPEYIEKSPEKSKDICIVVDTNVFISALSKVKDILNIRLPGDIKPIIFIPWMVMTELDYMKDSSSNKKLQSSISDSVKFINAALKDKHPQIKGQTVYEVDKQKQLGSSPDDKIISCCLQVAEFYESVILLSNDLNLKNRVMINGISVASSHDILVKIMSKLAITVKSQRVMQKMSIVCSSVICECTKEVYGNAWNKMSMLSCPPWSLSECLKRFKKYWRSVFKDKLMKQFIKVMEDLSIFLANNKFVPDDSEEYIKFMKLCITLCIFLKDIEECRSMVKGTLNEITKLG